VRAVCSRDVRTRPASVKVASPAALAGRRAAPSGRAAQSWLRATDRDRAAPGIPEAQSVQVFEILLAILAEAGMTAADLVRLNAYLTDPADLAACMAVRDRYVADPPPASTLLVMRALARPVFQVEIEAVAAKA